MVFSYTITKLKTKQKREDIYSDVKNNKNNNATFRELIRM